MDKDGSDNDKRPAYAYDLGAFLRAVVRRKMPALDEGALRKLTGTLQALQDLGWSFEDITLWVSFETKRIVADPTIKSPVGVLIRRLESGSPKDLPKPPERSNPNGISPDQGYIDKVRELQSLPPQVSVQVIQLLGRRYGDYHKAGVEAQAEFEKQGSPLPWDFDVRKLGITGEDVEEYIQWQRRQKEEKA